MLFWAIAGLTMALSAAVLLRAARRPGAAGAAEHPDMQVYRAQLAELERDARRGLIDAGEAQGLRNEIARRILDLDRNMAGPAAATAVEAGLAVPFALIAAAFVAAPLLYARFGAPLYPAVPHASRIAAAEALRAGRPTQAEAEAEAPATALTPQPEFAALMEQLRASTVAFPEKIEGFRLLAQYEARLGNFSAAARAKGREIELAGSAATAADHAERADLLVRAAGGIVTAEAESEIASALKLDPAFGTARFYAGLLEAQTGRPDRAFALWRPLYAESPPDAPWMAFLADRIGPLAAAAGVSYTPAPVNGPSAAEVAAAGEMSATDRAATIAGMVEGLEARLMDEGGSPEEWAQLLTALGVLNEPARRAAALARAASAYASDPQALATIRAVGASE